MSRALKNYRVTVVEWLSHTAVLTASSAEDAESKARRLWANNAEYIAFEFEGSGIESITVEDVTP